VKEKRDKTQERSVEKRSGEEKWREGERREERTFFLISASCFSRASRQVLSGSQYVARWLQGDP